MSGSAALRLAIFDVDGTLVDSQHAICAAMQAGFADCGLPAPDRAAILGVVGLSLPQAMAALMPKAGEAMHHRLAEAYRAAFLAQRASPGGGPPAPLYPGIRALLDALAAEADLLLGVATGKARRGLDHVCAQNGLERHFVTRQTADAHPSKPHPSMVEAALAETGVAPRRAVMIGDTSFDIEMGRAAGVRTVGVAWGYHPVQRLRDAGADRVVADCAGLHAALRDLWEDGG